jgi:hypothetical protein
MTQEPLLNSEISDYEDIIRQIRGVISARIVADETGTITEVHVLAGSGRSPKQVVRDIESAFMAQFGIQLDHKKISVAQLQDDDERAVEDGLRPRLLSVSLKSVGRHAESTVQLEIGDSIYEGTASGPGSAANKLRTVAVATLKALEEYLKGTCSLVADDLTVTNLGDRQAVVVSVSLLTNLGEERLVGSALIRSDDREAAVKATLSAVNRRLALLITGK